MKRTGDGPPRVSPFTLAILATAATNMRLVSKSIFSGTDALMLQYSIRLFYPPQILPKCRNSFLDRNLQDFSRRIITIVKIQSGIDGSDPMVYSENFLFNSSTGQENPQSEVIRPRKSSFPPEKQRSILLPLIVILLTVALFSCFIITTAASAGNVTLPDSITNLTPTLNGAGEGLGNSNVTVTFILFYNRNCHDCLRVLEFLPGFLNEHADAKVISYDIADDPVSRDLFQRYNERYGRPFSPVPAVFVGQQELVGYEEITTGLGAGIAAARANGTVFPLTPLPTTVPTGQTTPSGNESTPTITLPLIISAALVDGINPCAFAVLIFLLVTLLALESRRKVLAAGAAYTIAVFVFYFLTGLGIFTVVQVTGFSTVFSLVASVIALIAGIIMLRDALGTHKPILAIPESRKTMIDTYIRKSSVPAAFILGILVGMFELPCTGGIYLAILSLLSRESTLAQGIPYLLLYNVIFIVPLIIIIAIVFWGIPPERLATFRESNRRLIRFGMAIVMIVIAVYLLFTALQ